MKISAGFMCPQPEAAKSLCRYTYTQFCIHPHSRGGSLWWLSISLSLTTSTPHTQLTGRAAT